MEAATREGGRTAPIRRAPFVYALIVVDAVAVSLFSVATGGTFDVTVDIGGVAFAGGFRIAIWSTAPVCISWIKVTTSGSAPGGNALTGC